MTDSCLLLFFFALVASSMLRLREKEPTTACSSRLMEAAEMPRYRGDREGLGSVAHDPDSGVLLVMARVSMQLMAQQSVMYASVKHKTKQIFENFNYLYTYIYGLIIKAQLGCPACYKEDCFASFTLFP